MVDLTMKVPWDLQSSDLLQSSSKRRSKAPTVQLLEAWGAQMVLWELMTCVGEDGQ
jgi:hypothetical protein